MSDDWIRLGYLLAAVLFVLGLKGLSRPRTAVRGNLLGALGMLVAVVVTLTDRQILSFGWIVAGAIVGSAVGVTLATRVPITAMPELVALFNGFGGAASALVALANVDQGIDRGELESTAAVAAVLAVLIGTVTLTGSMIAFGKLSERLHLGGFGGIQLFNGVLLAAAEVEPLRELPEGDHAPGQGHGADQDGQHRRHRR
ncbi:MAG: NAD(P)(+) transhydrogenase (Re/Si-specific) subunit beta, partial [Actinomycetota bacterium]